ncbi:MAG: hypothetical protein J3Q66DRAFT_177906 [Benniella sp.]|nr:MAG: hypothetical protein J3Q66DRAFT_177906 [Benniella sp.]
MIREHLQEIANLTEQNTQLRRLVKKPDQKIAATPLKRPTHPNQHNGDGSEHTGSTGLEGGEVGSSRESLVQIESLKSALRFLRSENALLRTRTAMLDLGLSPDMSTLSGPLSRLSEADGLPLPSEADQSEVQKRQLKADSELKAVALETKRLLKDARIICASPKVVDLTKFTTSKAVAPPSTESAAAPTEGSEAATTATATAATTTRRAWLAQQSTPEWQYHSQQAALHTIEQRSRELKERLAKASRDAAPAASTPKLKKLSLTDAPIARVRLPVGMSGLVGASHSEKTKKDLAVFLRSSAEFEAMHQLFVR